MSDLDTAQTGAEVENAAAVPGAQQGSETTTEQTETPEQIQERDEKGRFQGRINELTRARREAERQAQYWQQQATAGQQQPPAQRQAPQTAPPSPEEFGWDMGKWSAAVTEYATTQATTQAQTQFQQQQESQHREQLFTAFDARERAYAQQNPGYTERAEQLLGVIQYNPQVAEILAISDHGPAMVDYLAQHLDEADAIARLPMHVAAMKLGSIEAKVSAPKYRPVSQAPAPAPGFAGGGQITQKDPAKMTDDEWFASTRKASR